LDREAKHLPSQEEEQQEEQQVATKNPVVAAPEFISVPVESEDKPENHQQPENKADRHDPPSKRVVAYQTLSASRTMQRPVLSGSLSKHGRICADCLQDAYRPLGRVERSQIGANGVSGVSAALLFDHRHKKADVVQYRYCTTSAYSTPASRQRRVAVRVVFRLRSLIY
jgi:hypothetical protein